MDTLHDPLWARVAPLRPRLRLQVRVQHRADRGGAWYLLVDDARRRFHRVDRVAWALLGRFDGSVSVAQAWGAVHDRHGEAAPTQGHVIRMLQHLHEAGMLSLDVLGDVDSALDRRGRRRQRIRLAVANPLSFKVPLFDPTRWLAPLLPLGRLLLTRWGLLAWVALVACGGVVALQHQADMARHLAAEARTAPFLLRLWLLFPLVKLLHEAGHALALRVFGVEVREVGLNFVLLTPLPYVDASGATALPSRARRIAISAMGVMVELAVASLAVLAWASTRSPGLALTALAMATGCGLSTLLFNANPLARFDGYHVLCDLLDLPNLASRGKAMGVHLARRWLLRDFRASPEPSRIDAVVVTLHAAASWLWQAVVALSIAWWLVEPVPLVAAMVALTAAWPLLLRPLANAAGTLLFDPSLRARRGRLLLAAGGGAVAVAATIGWVPVPAFSVEQGVVWAPAAAIVRAGQDGEVASVATVDHQPVAAGQPIAQLDDLALRGERADVAARLREIDIRRWDAMAGDAAEAARAAREQAALSARRDRLDARIASLTVAAGVAGHVVQPRQLLQVGHAVAQGQELAFIATGARTTLVKVALDEAQAARVRDGTTQVSVRLDGADRYVPARIERETPSVTTLLPTPLLGSAAGGPVLTDPTDSTGRRSAAPVAIHDVIVAERAVERIGNRVWVRFDHAPEPLARQWARALRQAFLARWGA